MRSEVALLFVAILLIALGAAVLAAAPAIHTLAKETLEHSWMAKVSTRAVKYVGSPKNLLMIRVVGVGSILAGAILAMLLVWNRLTQLP